MKAFTVFLLTLSMVLPSQVLGQTADPAHGTAICLQPSKHGVPCSFITGCPKKEESRLGGIVLNPFIQIGYQRNGVNMDVPLRAEYDPPFQWPHLAVGSIQASLEDYNFWVGTVGINALVSPNVTAFASATGFLPRDFVMAGRLPVSVGNFDFLTFLELTGSNLEYWILQCGASYDIGDGYALLGGFIGGKNSMRYINPRFGERPLENQTLTGDFLLKNWVPFVGLQVSEPNYYRAALIYSPVVTSSGALVLRTTLPVPAALTYNLNQPGTLLSFTFEYSFPLRPPSMATLWFNGTSQSIKGPSDVTYESPGVSLTQTADKLTIYQYSLSGGVSVGVFF